MTTLPFSDDEIVAALKRMLANAASILPSDSIDAVRYYIEHDEYEIAFEGLMLDLYKRGSLPKGFDTQEATTIAVALHLNEDSVLDSEFWDKFQRLMQAT
jgi:hypothetical protein